MRPSPEPQAVERPADRRGGTVFAAPLDLPHHLSDCRANR